MGGGRLREAVTHAIIDLQYTANVPYTSARQLQLFLKYLYSSTMTPGTGILFPLI